jgi:predicted transposase/invertase (TIGR01784 family)
MEIELYNDVAFKWIFGRQERTKPLISLLNAVIGHDGGEPVFEDIRIMNPFDMTKFSAEKYGILDIRVMDKRSGTWADVEVQVAYQSIFPERSMYYLAGMYRDQLRSGEDYEELRPCCGIHILLDDLFEDEPEWYNH